MTLAMHSMDDRAAGRERLSRVLGVASALYVLMALITAAVAALGLFGLAGVAVDPAAAEPARLLGLPWSLAISPVLAPSPTMLLLLAGGAMAVNAGLIQLAARMLRGA
ncbi:MAG: hypothetical protein Q7T19_07675 [Caulobacter sp.]|nr:hypothetical protein [Caulobacter sp.]